MVVLSQAAFILVTKLRDGGAGRGGGGSGGGSARSRGGRARGHLHALHGAGARGADGCAACGDRHHRWDQRRYKDSTCCRCRKRGHLRRGCDGEVESKTCEECGWSARDTGRAAQREGPARLAGVGREDAHWVRGGHMDEDAREALGRVCGR
ncbi:hypothetical protein JYU34_014847 [Plutella xylostella]|uniref:CCHC-type domain-containing protein n=1 Tax=Plutella xylostella TaxID=51655 RepID=A0ABQ7Q9F1_PLUXY|nr:hypothetical protein JYU34_014847 [Plutella xylostella]